MCFGGAGGAPTSASFYLPSVGAPWRAQPLGRCSELVAPSWTRTESYKPRPPGSAKKERDHLDLSAKLSFAGWTPADLAAASLHKQGSSTHPHGKKPCLLGLLGDSTWRLKRSGLLVRRNLC